MRLLLEREYAAIAIDKAKSIAAAIAHGPFTEGYVNLLSGLDREISYPPVETVAVRIANRVRAEIQSILHETEKWKEYDLSIEVQALKGDRYIVRFRYCPTDVRKLSLSKKANLLD